MAEFRWISSVVSDPDDLLVVGELSPATKRGTKGRVRMATDREVKALPKRYQALPKLKVHERES